MQTFLPYQDFRRSAKCLDRLRLGKQRLENKQIIQALVVPGSGWANHPAVKMWEGHVGWLVHYQAAIIEEWTRRGYKNSVVVPWMLDHGDPRPCWLGSPALHDSHKSNLLRKDPEHYGRMSWRVPPTLPYLWPSPDQRINKERALMWMREVGNAWS
jgi:hypothetical protein